MSPNPTEDGHGHCQVCGRLQKLREANRSGPTAYRTNAKYHVVAHHGYQRPGNGAIWGTCFGAMWQPYEIARDALQAALVSIEPALVSREAYLADLLNDPPAQLEHPSNARRIQVGQEPIFYNRPAGFTPLTETCHLANTYEYNYVRIAKGWQQQIQQSNELITTMVQRWDAWQPQEIPE